MTRETGILAGPYAALLTPRDAAGRIDMGLVRANVEFVLGRGMGGVCIGGATGEFTALSFEERKTLVETAARVVEGRGALLAGVGSGRFAESMELARHAAGCGARAVLLTPPHFFPYCQDDLLEYYRQAGAASPVPLLLYNLPSFTTPIEPETAWELVGRAPGIAGIKDSSGKLEILGGLTARGWTSCRIVGNDSALAEALRRGVCDGVISGVAGVFPELIRAVYDSRAAAAERLDELIAWLNRLPVPWGLKVAAECRGLAPAGFPIPVSGARAAVFEAFREWLEKSGYRAAAAG